MRRAVLLLAILAAAPAAASDGPGPGETGTDGTAFAGEGPDVLAALREVEASLAGSAVHDCVEEATSDPALRYRLMGTPTHDAFLAAYEDVFAELGLASALQTFERGGPGAAGRRPVEGGTNIVAVLPGRDSAAWVVLGGHYDTRELTLGGGALDNASGFCTVLEIARAFAAYVEAHGPLEASVVFVWYDGEEWGLWGAQAFAEDPSVARELLGVPTDGAVDILVSQSFDMPGLNYPAKNTWIQYGDRATTDEPAVLNLRTAPTHADEEWTCWSYGCYEELKTREDFAAILDRNTRYQALVREVAYDLLALPPEHVWVYDDGYGRSDHIPLIARGAAGMRIQGSHDEEYPHYHQPTDTLPALYELAGSREALVEGYTTETRVGGLVAFYAALTGGFGPETGDAAGAVAAVDGPAPVPGVGWIALAALVGAAAAARRR